MLTQRQLDRICDDIWHWTKIQKMVTPPIGYDEREVFNACKSRLFWLHRALSEYCLWC